MSRTALSEDTRYLVERMFGPQQRSAAAALLETRCGTGLPFMSEATPQSLQRIRFAVLKLGAGSIEALTRAVDAANTDWRDVLAAAGFAKVSSSTTPGSIGTRSDRQLDPGNSDARSSRLSTLP